MLRPLYPRRTDSVPNVQESGWTPVPVWRGADNLSRIGIRPSDRPARSQSPKQLYSWEDTFQTNWAFECVDWINRDQDADIWCVLMNMVLNFWIPQKVWRIFTKWETICFAFQQHRSNYAGYGLPQLHSSISLLPPQHSNHPHQMRNISRMFTQSILFPFTFIFCWSTCT